VRLLLAVLICTALPAFAQPCPPLDKACAREALKKHPAKQPEFWMRALGKPLGERIGPAPPELVDLLKMDNIANGYPNKPRIPKLEPGFVEEVRRAFEEIPEPVKRTLTGKLAGIYFVDDIGGTGFTDEVLNVRAGLGFIVLDPTVLMARTANEWATWKDNTPFRPDPKWKLTERIESPANDDRTHAIQYILLHELAHVIAIGGNLHPPWVLSPKEVKSTREYPFFGISWSVKGDDYVSAFDAAFPERKQVKFYFGAKLDGDAMKATYDALERTSFPTLYAATHPADDFAESLANYVHVVMMKRPFEIAISNAGKVVKTYRSCWSDERCAEKRRYLEELLGRR